MARVSAVLLVTVAVAIVAVNSQYLGFPYATTATSFSLPFIGGFRYAPAIAPVAPVLKAGLPLPYAAPGYPYGFPFAHPVGPVVKAAYPYGIVKTAVPALPAVVKAAVPFAAPFPAPAIGPYGPAPLAPAVKAAVPFAAPFPAPAIGPYGPAPLAPAPLAPAPALPAL